MHEGAGYSAGRRVEAESRVADDSGEVAAISIARAIVGTILSWVLILILSNWSRTTLLVPATISTAALIPGLAVAIVAGIAGALYPAIHAASVPPIESLRYE